MTLALVLAALLPAASAWSFLWLSGVGRGLVFGPYPNEARCEVKRQAIQVVLARHRIQTGQYLLGRCQEITSQGTARVYQRRAR